MLVAASSCATQSTSFTDTQGSVVGPGTSTPQRRTTFEGSPQAEVACEVVERRSASSMASGRTTIISAQSGLAASGAASTEATEAHPASPITESSPIPAIAEPRPTIRLSFGDSRAETLILNTL